MLRSQSAAAVDRRHFLLVPVLVALLGCVAEAPQRSAPPAAAPIAGDPPTAPASEAGHLMMMAGRLTFLPCGEGPDAVPVVDTPEGDGLTVVEELGGGGRPVPALVVRRADTLVEVRHAAPESGSCQALLQPGTLNARGNEPFWHLRVEADRAILSTPDLPDGRVFRDGGWLVPAGPGWRFAAAGGSAQLVLSLRAERCRDGMSGGWFPYLAVVEVDGATMQGCALEGKAAARSAP